MKIPLCFYEANPIYVEANPNNNAMLLISASHLFSDLKCQELLSDPSNEGRFSRLQPLCAWLAGAWSRRVQRKRFVAGKTARMGSNFILDPLGHVVYVRRPNGYVAGHRMPKYGRWGGKKRDTTAPVLCWTVADLQKDSWKGEAHAGM